MSEISISKHYKGGKHVGFRKFVGGRKFHLVSGTSPAHERLAMQIAKALVKAWEALERQGGQWTAEAIAECFALQDVDDGRAMPANADSSPAESSKAVAVTVTTFEALEKYKLYETDRWRRGLVEKSTRDCNLDRVEELKHGIPDVAMNALNGDALEKIVGYFTARPKTKKSSKGDGRMSYYTIKGLLKLLRAWLKWCAKAVRRFWIPYEDWEDDLSGDFVRRKMRELRAEARRRNARGFDQVKVLEARIRWQMSTPVLKTLLGMGLWCGHTQTEIATLEFVDFVDADANPVNFKTHSGDIWIDRLRHKTGVIGRWWIPPELVPVICEVVARTPLDVKKNPHGLAILGSAGMPLVHHGMNDERRKTDVVADWWRSITRAAVHYGVRPLSFKYLRKTLSQQVRDKLGREFSELFLAQVQTDVNSEFYNKSNFDKLEAAVRDIYAAGWNQMFQKINLEDYFVKEDATKAA